MVGSGRRLPSWMLGQGSKSDNGDTNNHHQEEQVASHSKPKKPASRHSEKESSIANSGLPAKCETKRRKRISSREDIETIRENKNYNGQGRKVREAAPLKRQKVKTASFEIAQELEIPSHSDDDVELTMEDLLGIAEEYVKADKDKGLQSSNGECESERQLPTTASPRNESGGSLGAPNSNQRTATQETTASYNSTSILTSEQTLLKTSRTGDPAQDMLDLFLGPLLKKPLEEEKNTEFTTKDMAFGYEIKKLSQNDVGEQMVPQMKKKSSLKDKVAMLLD